MPVPSTTTNDPIAISEAYERLTSDGMIVPEDIAIVATDPDTWRAYIAWKIDAAQRFGRLAEVVRPGVSPMSERDNDCGALQVVRDLAGDHLTYIREGHALMAQPFIGGLNGDQPWDNNSADLVALSVHLAHLQEVARVRYLAFRAALPQA